MKSNKDLLKKKWLPLTIALCIAVVVYLGLSHINLLFVGIGKFAGFVYPVFIGLVIAYILDPLIGVFERHVFKGIRRYGYRRNLSVICGLLVVILGIVFLLIALVPQIVNSILTFAGNIDNYARGLQNLLGQLEAKSSGWKMDISGILSAVENGLQSLTDKLPSNLDSIVDTTVSVGQNVLSWIIGFIIAIYFLVDKVRLQHWFGRLFRACVTEKTYESSSNFWNRCNRILIRYIVCDLVDGLIIGVANFVFMLIARMPYGVLISVVVGVTNLAPTFGPLVGAVIGGFILVLVKPWYALWFLIFTIILQTIDGYVLKPKLFGTLLGVSGVWILICIVVGGRMFGVAGVLLAIPFAAIMDFVYKEFILVKLDERKKRREGKAATKEAETVSAEPADRNQDITGQNESTV